MVLATASSGRRAMGPEPGIANVIFPWQLGDEIGAGDASAVGVGDGSAASAPDALAAIAGTASATEIAPKPASLRTVGSTVTSEVLRLGTQRLSAGDGWRVTGRQRWHSSREMTAQVQTPETWEKILPNHPLSAHVGRRMPTASPAMPSRRAGHLSTGPNSERRGRRFKSGYPDRVSAREGRYSAEGDRPPLVSRSVPEIWEKVLNSGGQRVLPRSRRRRSSTATGDVGLDGAAHVECRVPQSG